MKLIIILLIAFFIDVSAQRFDIKGTITDSSGLPLSGVNVFITETDFGAASDENGNYILRNLRPGRYTIQFSMIGYKKVTLPGVVISNSSVEQNIVMVSQVIESKQVLITAGKHQQILEDLSESAEIISAENFSGRNYITLEDAFRYVPGVVMTDYQISIRGSTGYGKGAGTRVLLALDGIPFYTGDTGEIIWEILPLADIDRVEVLKGAASALYGSAAIGGMINVITKRVEPVPVSTFRSYYGIYDKPVYEQWDWSNDYRSFNGISLSHSNRINDLGFTVSLNRQQDLGYKQSGYFTRYIGYLKTIYNFSPSSSVSFFANALDQRRGNFLYWKDLENALVPRDEDQGNKVKTNRYMFGLIYKQLFSTSFYMNFRSSYYRTKWEDLSVAMNTSLANLYRNEIQINLSLDNRTLLITGVENTIGKTEANIFGNRSSLGAAVYAEIEHEFSDIFTVTAGARYDYNKIETLESSDAFSPKAGINYKISDQFIFRTSAGTGFRGPSLAEVFTSTTTSGITVRPNPALKPEKSVSFEAGLLYKLNEHIYIDGAIFQNEFYDFIEPELRVDESGDSYGIFDNITRARIQGFEFNQDYYFLDNQLNLSLSYTYLWTKDLNTGKALRYRPRHLALINSNYRFSNFETGIGFRYSSKVEEIDFDLIKYVPIPGGETRVDVYVLDFSLGYNLISIGVPGKLFFNTKNLLNYYYIELIGNLAPVRSYSLNAEFFF